MDRSLESDDQLLLRFSQKHDEDAFRALVERHFNIVYSIARRETGNEDLSKDVWQRVFILLAQNSNRPSSSAHLVLWLHRVTRNMARSLIRAENRRLRRESMALELSSLNDSASHWEKLAPEIDSLVSRLKSADRQIVLLRYYSGYSHAELAKQLQLTPEGARKRCDRALERLRDLFNKRGVTTTSAALSSLLPSYMAGAAPANLAQTIARVALAAPSAASALPALSFVIMKSTTKIAIVAASAVAILATAIFIEKRVGNPSSADGRSLAGDPPSLKNSPSKRSPAVSPQRSSGTRNPKASAAEPDLTELKALMQVTDPGIRRTKLAEYLSQIDQADIKPALDYIVSLGPAYENDRGKILKKWVESDPQKAMSWAQKNNPSSVQALLGVWTWKDPDAAIAWADATSSATLDGNPLYPSIISNLNDSPDRIEKVSRLLQSVPPTSKEAAGLSRDVAGYVLAQTKGQESPDDAAKLLGSLPEQWRDNTTQALMAKLMFDDPKKGLDWLRSSTAFSGIAGSDEGIKSMLLYAYQANHEEVVSQYIAGIPSGAERTKFEGQLMQVRKLRAGVPDVQGSRVRLGN